MAKYYIASDFLIISLIDEPIFSSTVPAKLQTYIAAKKPILAIIKGDVANIVIDNNPWYFCRTLKYKAYKRGIYKEHRYDRK
jgi:hypothetical protein